MTRFLTDDGVIAINKLYNDNGIRDAVALSSAVAEPQQGAFGVEFHPTLTDKAAVLFRGIARNHAFIDGNKRTALVATDVFLRGNGRALNVDTEELVTLTLDVAQGHISVPELAETLDAWVVPPHQINRCTIGRAADALSQL